MMKLVCLFVLISVVYGGVYKRQVSSNPAPVIKILSFENDASPDGIYNWSYGTENGISANEAGQPSGPGEDAGTVAQGSYKYTSPEGVPVAITYVADLEGFRAEGDVIPTPPPIPQEIARALNYNQAHPEQDNQQPAKAYSLPKAPLARQGSYKQPGSSFSLSKV